MTSNSRRCVASVIQAGSIPFDTPQSLEKLADLTAQARVQGADLVLFPEAFIGGYPKGWQFGISLGQRTSEGREEFRRYAAGAIEVPGPEVDRLAAIAKSNHVYLVTGIVERAGGTLYCSVLFFDPQGVLLGKHRKLMPTALERCLWGMGDGSMMPVLQTRVGKIGAVICWENYMPLLRTAMYGQGIELYCAPTVDDRETWISTMRHVACEGRCFVLSACQFLPAEPQYSEMPSEMPPLIRGGSCIVSPLGDLLAGPVYGAEQILTAGIDFDEILRAKFDLDVVGHYARPDIFQLNINRSPQTTMGCLEPDAREVLGSETD